MRDALRLMAKVFGVVFGAGAAVVVLGYLALGGLYIYNRIEAPKPVDYDALAKKYGGTSITSASFTPLYETTGFIPHDLPQAQLDCTNSDKPRMKPRGKGPLCWVEIDDKIAATIARQEAKDNLAGWMTVPNPFGQPEPLKSNPPPCPASDPLGLNTKAKCTPRPGR